MFPKIPLGEGAEWVENFLVDNFGLLFNLIRDGVDGIVGFLQTMLYMPIYWVPLAFALIFMLHFKIGLSVNDFKLPKWLTVILSLIISVFVIQGLNLVLLPFLSVNIVGLALLFFLTRSVKVTAAQILMFVVAYATGIFVPELTSPIMFAVFIGSLAYTRSGTGVAVFAALGIMLISNIGLWEQSVQTISLILTSTLLALVISIPLGILAAKNDTVDAFLRPILDFMQTMPAFVYLIPAVVLFDIGSTPAAVATIIFAMPPAIRLTNLGIRQVPEELVEAGKAFGSTPSQMLFKIQLPQAMPTIMAGINQCIMLSLSMVVIASMIGARGLGSVVMRGVSQLETGVGFEGGIAVVIIAIILDRLTQGVSK
ncbi:ABC transporter permease subunit [Proteinivorax hydrogeniformans]|uniref:ABC transporter permease subunit n=1 Tax=Proteinivorax hydrogeniformans TaxID=1826727 RepID=A0AAU8HT65_9FIRM